MVIYVDMCVYINIHVMFHMLIRDSFVISCPAHFPIQLSFALASHPNFDSTSSLRPNRPLAPSVWPVYEHFPPDSPDRLPWQNPFSTADPARRCSHLSSRQSDCSRIWKHWGSPVSFLVLLVNDDFDWIESSFGVVVARSCFLQLFAVDW